MKIATMAIFFPRRAAALLLVLLALSSLLAGAPAAAQEQSPFTLDVRVGYEGVYRIGDWFPVIVEVGNSGPDTSAVLEWSFPGQLDEQVFRQQVDLPSGSRKRVTMNVFASGFARNGQVRLLEGDTVLGVRDVSLNSADEGVFLSVVVSADPAMLNSLETLQIAGSSGGARVRHVAADDLPDHIAALRGINAIFLHDVDTTALSPAQRDALGIWVSLGGQLIVSGGVGGQRTAAGLAGLLPAQVGTLAQGDISALAPFAGASDQTLAPSAPLNDLQPQSGAEALPPESPLLYRQRYGAGWSIVSAFDFASLRSWSGEPALWSKLLSHPIALVPAASARLSRINLLDRGVLQLPSLNLPSTSVLLAFLLTYILVIGPLNYVVLRRARRLELAWLTVPAIVVVFAGGLYVVGSALRGGQAQFNQAAVVQGAEGQQRAAATAFIGLFSPSRASYAIGFTPDTLVSNAAGRASLSDQFDTLVTDTTGARSVNVLADVASVNTFVAHAAVDLPVSVQTDLISDTSGLRGEVRNTGPSALQDVMLVRGSTFARLGSLAPGASQQVAGGLEPNFPRAVNLSPADVFDRQEMLNALFDRDFIRASNPGLPSGDSSDDVYLLAWASQPTIAATVDGRPASQKGLTLYVIRLQPVRARAG